MTIRQFKSLSRAKQHELADHLEALRRQKPKGLHPDEAAFLEELTTLESQLGGSLLPQ